MVIDINGYFVSDPTQLSFFTLPPCRIADTRSTDSYVPGGTSSNFSVSGLCGVPTNAQAYFLNMTVVPHGPLGYITAWAASQAQPGTSTLNAGTGTTTANAAVVSAGTSGQISVFASNDTDLVIDVSGYFAPSASNGLALYPFNPCRIIDTRASGGQPFTGTISVNAGASSCAFPAFAQAFVLTATVVPPGPLGYLTMWPDGQTQPNTSTLNSLDGVEMSNLAVIANQDGVIDAFASNATQMVLDTWGYFAQSGSGGNPYNGYFGLSSQNPTTPSASGCGDISGAWTDGSNPQANWQITQNGSNVSGTVTVSSGPSCGDVTWQVSGNASDPEAGTFSLTASNPSPSVDGCGNTANSNVYETVTLDAGQSCTAGSADVTDSPGASAGASFFSASEPQQFTTSWTGQRPTSLQVKTVHIFSYAEEQAVGYPPGCAGIVIGITYQVLDQNAKAMQVRGLVPQEQVLNLIYDGGTPLGDPVPNFVDITRGMTTDSTGQFPDSPFGDCSVGGSSTATDTQNIRIVNPKNAGYWLVRTNNWSYNNTSPGHGSVTNNSDVHAQH